jgi:hypothetical protein
MELWKKLDADRTRDRHTLDDLGRAEIEKTLLALNGSRQKRQHSNRILNLSLNSTNMPKIGKIYF